MSPDVLMGWLPVPVMASLLFVFIKREIARLEKDKAKTDATLERIDKTLTEIEKRFISTPTKEGVEAMGNRLTAAQQAATAEQNVRLAALDRDVTLFKYIIEQDRKK